MHLPEILNADNLDEAALLLHMYYTEEMTTGAIRTGARFDSWAGGGDAPEVVNRVTADDLVALALLGVEVKGPAVVGLLETHSAEVTRLLQQIPADVDLADVEPSDFSELLGKGSAAWQLWDVFRGRKGGLWKMGPTKTSKLLARKRPRLIPIWDSVVTRAVGLDDSPTQWEEWHEQLTVGGGELTRHLDTLRVKADLPEPITALRAMDVVLWMSGRQSASAGDEQADT